MTTKKIPLAQYTVLTHATRSIEEAVSELQRELETRRRIIDRWIMEGRISWIDAHDRLERHLTALKLLIEYSDLLEEQAAQDVPSTSTPSTFKADFSLAHAAADQAA
jgi:hypothetical protein